MKEYKCIACGHTKESEKDCSCSECGYKMFQTPFDRKDILINEIHRFIKSLMLDKIEDHWLSYYREELKRKTKSDDEKDVYERILKSKDDNRFPSFDKIQNFVCSADKTEKFVERLNASLDQIEKHICTPFQIEYLTDYTQLYHKLDGYEVVIKKALSVFEEKIEIKKSSLLKRSLIILNCQMRTYYRLQNC